MAKTTPPAGKVKGGARFPRFGLEDALTWAKKLVSKTHLGPQPQDILFASVVGSKGPRGEIKISALKQFDLLEGTSKAYQATKLSRAIVAAPPDEAPALLAQAALAPTVFKALFETFHGDEVSTAKLKQRAADLKVHPDEVERCVNLYVASLEVARLVTTAGDVVRHVTDAAAAAGKKLEPETDVASVEDEVADSAQEGFLPGSENGELGAETGLRPRAAFQVTINLDASLDTEKLERQLQLLKRYGAI
jgi:hypothetical protein